MSTAPYGSPARILAFGGVPGAIHCGDSAEVYTSDRAEAAGVCVAAGAVGLDARVMPATAEERAKHGGSIKVVARPRADVMRPELDAGLAEVAMGWPREGAR
jgi:hypothetical protein